MYYKKLSYPLSLPGATLCRKNDGKAFRRIRAFVLDKKNRIGQNVEAV